jgi:hypothetical protein
VDRFFLARRARVAATRLVECDLTGASLEHIASLSGDVDMCRVKKPGGDDSDGFLDPFDVARVGDLAKVSGGGGNNTSGDDGEGERDGATASSGDGPTKKLAALLRAKLVPTTTPAAPSNDNGDTHESKSAAERHRRAEELERDVDGFAADLVRLIRSKLSQSPVNMRGYTPADDPMVGKTSIDVESGNMV